jgi:hypothetical protein
MFNDQKILTARGGTWQATQVIRLLNRLEQRAIPVRLT